MPHYRTFSVSLEPFRSQSLAVAKSKFRSRFPSVTSGKRNASTLPGPSDKFTIKTSGDLINRGLRAQKASASSYLPLISKDTVSISQDGLKAMHGGGMVKLGNLFVGSAASGGSFSAQANINSKQVVAEYTKNISGVSTPNQISLIT